jgi:hypothetical protein
MPTAFQDEAGSQPTVGRLRPADLLSGLLILPPEIRLCLYHLLFDKRVFMVLSVQDEQTNNAAKKRAKLEKRHYDGKQNKWRRIDHFARLARSAQFLRVCKTVYREALPVLYSNTSFYLYGGVRLTHFSKFYPGRHVQNIAIRMDVEQGMKYSDLARTLQPLDMPEAAFPNLASLQIRINASHPGHPVRVFSKYFIRYITLRRILRIQESHGKLRCLFERKIPGGNVVGFRLATSEDAMREDVRASISCPPFLLTDLS